VIAAGAPLNVTVLLLWTEPKFAPLICTGVPYHPEVGATPEIEIDPSKLNGTVLLVIPLSVSETVPLVAPEGTVTVTLVSLHDVTLAVAALILTELVPWVEPKPLPWRMIEPPTGAAGGLRLLMIGLYTVPRAPKR
jgi:hypothetical protein